MGRRSGFIGLMNAIARDSARSARQAEAEQRRQERLAIKAQREAQRELVLAEKEARLQYLEDRASEVDDLNEDLNETIKYLQSILNQTLQISHVISFESLRIKDKFKPFNPPKKLATPLTEPQKDDFMVKALGFFEKLIPGSDKRYQKSVHESEEKYKVALENYEKAEANRKTNLEKFMEEYEREKQSFLLKIQERNQVVDELESTYYKGDKEAVLTYNTMVLERSDYPAGFPQSFRLAYIPESKELVVEYELPLKEIIPSIQEYKYVKSKDQVTQKARKVVEIKELYQDVVAATTLRTIHEVLEADQGNNIEVVVFNGFVNTVDSATGKDVRPCLISIRVTKENFNQINLSKINKITCLRNLGAQVSPRPAELQPIKPIVEFDMVDKRFVDQEDILNSLDSRPNLMDLNPFEFENLISNLFGKMGLETKLTRSSRDGGIDAVAFDTRPIVGGKVVIQAKRYKNTVGVSAVRDLYGTMMNEGANKGILVTTSGYGPDAYDFSNDKPIELIDGGGLLYLLEQNGFKAKIIFPEDQTLSFGQEGG